MADAVVDKNDTTPEEVSSTEATKESPVKKSPLKKVAEVPETNGTEEKNGGGDVPDEKVSTENGDGEESNDATENGDAKKDKKEVAVKRKSTAGDGDVPEIITPEKKAKVTEEPAESEEVAA